MRLKVLYPEPAQASQDPRSMDIVAVHGLNGDPRKTWTHEKTECFWLKDLLPYDLEAARIMTFGYNASSSLSDTYGDFHDTAIGLLSCLADEREDNADSQRPVTFIAHSLGGIVVKEALTCAHVDKRYQEILDCTLGIMFFGTPHRGSEKADYGKVLSNVAAAVLNKPKSNFLNDLQSNSKQLMTLIEKFRFLASALKFVTFYEQKPTGNSGRIVEKHSVFLELPGEDQLPVDANHKDLCKFESQDNETYKKVVRRLKRMLKDKETAGDTTQWASNTMPHRRQHNRYFEVPRSLSSIFTGRDDVMKELGARCLPMGTSTAQKTQKRYIIHGLGGSGKTQICLKFAQEHRQRFFGIFFIDASSAIKAEQGFSAMAERCNAGNEMEHFKGWLTNLTEDWLLVIDNADDLALNISKFFPTGDRGTILITTRNPECEAHATVGSRKISEMDCEEAISLLLKASNYPETDDSFRSQARPVVETLSCLALAIVHAGALVRKKLYSFKEYCEAYKKRRKEILSYRPVQDSSDYGYPVYTTWKVSLDSIKAIARGSQGATREERQNATHALDLLTFFGFCHFDGICDDFFRVAWEWENESCMCNPKCYSWWRSGIVGILQRDRPQEWDPLPLRQALDLLSSYSLVERFDVHIALHPLVHSWIVDSLDRDDYLRQWTTSLLTIAMMCTGTDVQSYHRRLVPHIQSCLGAGELDKLLDKDDHAEERASIVLDLTQVLCNRFQWAEVLTLSEKALKYTLRTLHGEHPLTWKLLYGMAYIYYHQGQHQKTIDLLHERVEPLLLSLTKVTSSIALSASCLLSAYEEVTHREQTLKRVLELGERLQSLCAHSLDEAGGVKFNVEDMLARLHSRMGRTAYAVVLSEKSVERQNILGSHKPQYVKSRLQLGNLYVKAGRINKAVETLQDVVEMHRSLFGEDHLDTLHSQYCLARAYARLGKLEYGLPLLRDAIKTGRKNGVPDAFLQKWEKGLESILSQAGVHSQRQERSSLPVRQGGRGGNNGNGRQSRFDNQGIRRGHDIWTVRSSREGKREGCDHIQSNN